MRGNGTSETAMSRADSQKVFFSEEKKQKTFGRLSRFYPAA
jgi:hypothetical protein